MTGNLVFWLLALGVLGSTGWHLYGQRHDPDRVRARWLAGLRGGAALLLAAILLQPQFRRREAVIERPVIGVLVDTSQSMNDGPASATRGEMALKWLRSPAFREASNTCDFRYFSVASDLTETVPGELAFEGAESRIGSALADWTRRWGREAAAGVVLLSDGLDTAGGLPTGLDLPCWVLEVEPPEEAALARVAVWQVEPPRRPVAGAETSVRVVLQGWGVDGSDIPVELWSEGRKVGEKRLRFTRRGEVLETMLPLKPERPGSYAYEIRVADAAADPAAKSQPFVVAVRQEGRSVLLLTNTLGFEGKFLRRALTTDRNVRLDSYTRWPDGRWACFGDSGADANGTLNLSAAALSSRSAVILADVAPESLNPAQWQALADYAGRGGGLIVLGGPNLLGSPRTAAVLGRILPVPTPAPHHDGRFGVKLTDAGLRHPVFGPLFEAVKDFPALQGANLASGVAGNAQVLMEAIADGRSRPLVVVKQQGSGRVAVVLSDTLWRWRVAAPGWTGRQSPYDTFWGQMLDWLAPDQEGLQSGGRVELTADRPFYRQGERVALLAEWIGKGPPPFEALDAPDKSPTGDSRPLALTPAVWQNADGRRVTGFRGEIETDATGVHEVDAHAGWAGGEARASLRFAVAASAEERRGEPPDAGYLKELASLSHGGYFSLEAADQWLEALPKPDRQTERVVVSDAWNHPLAVIVLLGCLAAEWWLRRRRGLA
ncbi:MAG: glutamine amidotransferase [Akkermansiaceae bacterium]|nr:glutamine amidotransferase [Akkermansiaceae bacterium]